MSKLYIIPTPIGNLEDMTLRAIRLLKEADLILAEDTRKSRVLLEHYAIPTAMKSFHLANEHRILGKVVEAIRAGQKTALISDAGTPGISDPGYLLIRECIREGIAVETLPGATAFVPALLNSGLPAERFVFEGFLPHKKGRKTRLEKLQTEDRSIVLYESPHRLLKTLRQLAEFLGPERSASVSRELSKKFEETRRGSLADLLEHFQTHPVKGEFVIVIAGREKKKAT